jgi:hypothetical protein
MIELCLPLPVSVNKAYANSVGGRRKTAEATAWYNEARRFAVPFVKQYSKICDSNLLARRPFYSEKRGIKLAALKAAYPEVAYGVVYTYHFANDAIRDVFNFEKLLTDLLVECGFMLDDNFIVDGRVKWGKLNPSAPHVEVEIISLDRQAVLGYNMSTR